MEQLKHECGVAMIRLLQPLEYYEKKYGTWMYGLNKLYLLMEKQHNRGQEGAGLACVKLEANPGEEYMFRERALGSGAITEIFEAVQSNFKDLTPEQLHDAAFAKRTLPFAGEVYMGHLRYSTTGKSGISYVHPFLRRNNWRAKNLALCGNFNMTNVDEIFARITAIGQHPRKYADTYIMLEQVGHRLDREVERLFNLAEAEGLTGMGVTHYIEEHIELANVLRTSSREWDGGYVICGLTGSGESFAIRDPWGIRPAFWYQDDEIAVLASERPVIQTALNVPVEKIKELQTFISRFSANKSKSRQATSRRKLLDKLTVEELPASSRRYPFIGFDMDRVAGKDILFVRDLTKTVGGVTLFKNLSFTVNKDDKIALVGNEQAITALFRILMEEDTPDSGDFKWGVSITKSYFPHDNTPYFKDCDLSIIEWLGQYAKETTETYLRGFLGRMLFSGDSVFKPVKVLSGGEKVRCMFSRMMLFGSNFLLLDQPTDHLDLESISAVNNGLSAFKGNVIFTSHDYELVNTVANRIIEITPDGMRDYSGTFEGFLERKKQESEA